MTSELKNRIARHIKERRTSLGLTQRDMAKKVGVSAASINAYENGSTSPTIENLVQIADFFGCQVSELYSDQPLTNGVVVANNQAVNGGIIAVNSKNTASPHYGDSGVDDKKKALSDGYYQGRYDQQTVLVEQLQEENKQLKALLEKANNIIEILSERVPTK